MNNNKETRLALVIPEQCDRTFGGEKGKKKKRGTERDHMLDTSRAHTQPGPV